MSSRKGLPDYRKMRHDRHFVEELAGNSITTIGLMVAIDRIETNREQPRTNIGDLTELVNSVRTKGVLEPLLIRRIPDSSKYQLIAGERRFHAAIEAGLSEVPCIEITASDQEALELALVENLQRKDLSPFEEAEGYRTLVEKYGYTHEQVSDAVGKSRTTISETLKLINMPPGIRDLCRHADITAKSILLLISRAHSIEEMERLVQEIAENNLDRAAARIAAQDDGSSADNKPQSEGDNGDNHSTGRFRPIQFRFQQPSNPAVRLALSIRRPGVSRQEIIQTLEALLDEIRRGTLDERLNDNTEKSKISL